VKCPCRCRNAFCEDKRTLTLHIYKFGFMPDYEVWTHHGESVRQRTTSVAEEEDDRSSDDRMDEMLNATWSELETNSEDPPTLKVQKFFDMFRVSEEPLHEHTIVSVLAFVTRLTTIKSKFTFSNKYYNELLSLISDVLPNNHKMLKDMSYTSLLQDLHPHTDLGVATLFTPLQRLVMTTGESLVLLCCVLIINLILIY
jgi:hypothetical protein